MPKGSLIFVQGTGERLKAIQPFLTQLKARLEQFAIAYALEPVIWGDAVGAEFEGKSLPDPPREPLGGQALAEYAEWTYLGADPLFGLRLLAMPDASSAGAPEGLLGRPKWEAAWEIVKKYTPSPDLKAL